MNEPSSFTPHDRQHLAKLLRALANQRAADYNCSPLSLTEWLAADALESFAVSERTPQEIGRDIKAALERSPDKNDRELEAEFREWIRGKDLYGYAAGMKAWKESRRRCLAASSAKKETALVVACRGLISYWTRNLNNFQWEKADDHVKAINAELRALSDGGTDK